MADTSGKPVRTKDIFRAYHRQARKHARLFWVVVFSIVGIQAVDLAVPLYLRQIFNLLASSSPAPDVIHRLLGFVGAVAAVLFCGWLARRLYVYALTKLESRTMADLYVSAFDYLIRHSYHFFISRFSGTLTRRVSKFAAAFETMLDGVMEQFFPMALFAGGAVVVLFLRNHILGAALGLWVAGFVVFQLYVARWRQPYRVARAEADSRMVGVLADAISNQNTIALFSGTAHEHGLFHNVAGFWQKATARSWSADERIWSVIGLLMVGINVGLLFGAVKFWQRGLVTVGDFALIQGYLLGLFDRLVGMNRGVRRFYDAYADAMEMVEILEAPHDVRDKPGAAPLRVSRGDIAFRRVDFYFHETRPVLENFNLSIPSGEKLALVGPSGAGKTTVTKLLLRLYDVARGAIEIDGQNIADATQDSVRNAIAFVPQEPVLFHRTLLENIRYGRRDASDEEVVAAARQAHCDEFISHLPEGYQTYVGERGVKLSGGERQRVAIARALLKDAPILVLDEATSSLDSESEAFIQDALQTLMRGKTVLVIAHRLSTIMKMDRIVVIEDGRIIAQGDHRALLRERGLYQKLWSIQAGGFRDDEYAAGEETPLEEEVLPGEEGAGEEAERSDEK